MSTGFAPNQEWLDDVFREEVMPDLFADAAAQERPVVVLLGGQPGAGKTRATQFAQADHADSLVCINGDDFRVLHPDYVTLQAHEEAAAHMPETLAALGESPVVDRLTLVNRSGEVLFDDLRAHAQSGASPSSRYTPKRPSRAAASACRMTFAV